MTTDSKTMDREILKRTLQFHVLKGEWREVGKLLLKNTHLDLEEIKKYLRTAKIIANKDPIKATLFLKLKIIWKDGYKKMEQAVENKNWKLVRKYLVTLKIVEKKDLDNFLENIIEAGKIDSKTAVAVLKAQIEHQNLEQERIKKEDKLKQMIENIEKTGE